MVSGILQFLWFLSRRDNYNYLPINKTSQLQTEWTTLKKRGLLKVKRIKQTALLAWKTLTEK
jgi:hypothetical protein